MLYRVLSPLTTGHKPGDVVATEDFREGVAEVLAERGTLAPVVSPPLTELPGWELRARKLAAVGIVTIADLLDRSDEAIMEAIEYKTTRAIKRWKTEAAQWLVAPNKESGCRRC